MIDYYYYYYYYYYDASLMPHLYEDDLKVFFEGTSKKDKSATSVCFIHVYIM